MVLLQLHISQIEIFTQNACARFLVTQHRTQRTIFVGMHGLPIYYSVQLTHYAEFAQVHLQALNELPLMITVFRQHGLTCTA